MRCRYEERLTYAGDMIFGAVYASFGKAGTRRGKFRPTSETQQKLNERKSAEAVTWLVHANFTKDDYVVHPTYSNRNLPETEEEFQRDVRNYLKRLRRLYQKAGAEMKYIYTMEYSSTGRPHIHLFLSGGIPEKDVRAAWKLGRINTDELQFDECGVVDLAKYIAKSQRGAGRRRFVGSKNLVKPVERRNVHPYSRRRLKELDESQNPHRFFAETYPGYCLSEPPKIMKNGVNGQYYMTFVMYNPDGPNLADYCRRRKSETAY